MPTAEDDAPESLWVRSRGIIRVCGPSWGSKSYAVVQSCLASVLQTPPLGHGECASASCPQQEKGEGLVPLLNGGNNDENHSDYGADTEPAESQPIWEPESEGEMAKGPDPVANRFTPVGHAYRMPQRELLRVNSSPSLSARSDIRRAPLGAGLSPGLPQLTDPASLGVVGSSSERLGYVRFIPDPLVAAPDPTHRVM